MRILITGASYLARSLKKLGHEVVCANHQPDADLALAHPVSVERLWNKLANFAPDLFCYFDNGNLPIVIDPENTQCPALYYSIDTYCNPWHLGYAHWV